MSLFGHLPLLDPIVAHEVTDYGWRGLTGSGELLEVRSNGHKAEMPDGEILVRSNDRVIGRRLIHADAPNVADYLDHQNRGIAAFRAGDCVTALDEYDAAITVASTARARFNRSMPLLALGRWREGFADHEARHAFGRSVWCDNAVKLGIPLWRGEDIGGKRLLLVHDAGFGDTIMMLRYVPMLTGMGAEVSLSVPPELESLCAQAASVVTPRADQFDFYCPILSLTHRLDQTTDTIPSGWYLSVDPVYVAQWRRTIRSMREKTIGIVWSIGKQDTDFPRAIPLSLLTGALDGEAELFSLQQQGQAEAELLGVHTHRFKNFADCAALMSLMDQIVTVDTAAAHVAGAIGHPNVIVLLAHLHDWRWLGNRFYPHVRLCRQTEQGNWASALVQL